MGLTGFYSSVQLETEVEKLEKKKQKTTDSSLPTSQKNCNGWIISTLVSALFYIWSGGYLIGNISQSLQIYSSRRKLNISKTQILRTTSRQQHVSNQQEKIILDAKDNKGENIKPSNSAKILGIIFNKSLIWREFLEVGKDAMVGKLKRKLGALKYTSK